MKNRLQSDLDQYKRDNTEESKKALLSTIDSVTHSLTNDEQGLKSVELAKHALTSSITNKGEVVSSVESLISSLT